MSNAKPVNSSEEKGKVYVKGLKDKKLETDEVEFIYLTFQVKKDNNGIILDNSDKDAKQNVAEINGCHFNVTEDSINGLKDFDKYKKHILASGIDCKKYPWLYFPLARSFPGLSVMACKKSYRNNEVAGCLTLSYRVINRNSL